VFADSEGRFFIRLKHNHAVTVQVLTDQFTSGRWQVSNQPDAVTPGAEAKITVQRKS